MAFRRGYRRKLRAHGEVELNMAAMLDMAFQLLAFFILTFRPSPVETQISLRMPPNEAVTKSAGASANPQPKEDFENFRLLLNVQLLADANGQLTKVVVAEQSIQAPTAEALYQALEQRLASIFSNDASEGVALQVQDTLQYESLLRVMDICGRQKLPTGERVNSISISPLP